MRCYAGGYQKEIRDVDGFRWSAPSLFSSSVWQYHWPALWWFSEEYDPDTTSAFSRDQDWKKLIGDDNKATLGDVSEMLMLSPNMPGWRKLRLALLLIVDGVLIANTQTHRPTPKYVRLLEDLESFSLLLGVENASSRVVGKCVGPIGSFRQSLQ